MKRALLVSLLLSLSACGLVGEKEKPPATYVASDGAPGCKFPEFDRMGSVDEMMLKLDQAADCAQQNLDHAFKSVKGAIEDELSIPELRELVKRGIVTVEIRDPSEWEGATGFLTLFHPDGRPAVQRQVIQKVINLYRKNRALIRRLSELQPRDPDSIDLVDANIGIFRELLDLISPRGRVTLGQAQAIADAFCRRGGNACQNLRTPPREMVSAAFALKGLALADPDREGPFGPLRGDSIRALVDVAYDLSVRLRSLRMWLQNQGPSNAIPANLPSELNEAAVAMKAYFRSQRFTPIPLPYLRMAIEQLSPGSGLADLAPDLISISQKLALSETSLHRRRRTAEPAPQIYDGLHPVPLLSLLDQAGPFGQDLKAAVANSPYGRCEYCQASLREALAHPFLKKIALKGHTGYSYNTAGDGQPQRADKRLDAQLWWSSIIERVLQRRLIAKLFGAFDRNGDGTIPLEGTYEDSQEAIGLANTFLRFASVGSGKERGEDGPDTPSEPRPPIPVRAAPLYRIMALVGDRWLPDGNQDEALNSDEFFSVVAVYNDVQRRAQWVLPYMTNVYTPVPGPQNRWETPGGLIYERLPFIEGMWSTVGSAFNFLWLEISSLESRDSWPPEPELPRESEERPLTSFFHSLMGRSCRSIVGYEFLDNGEVSPRPRELTDYVRSDASLAPTAVLALLDRLMIRCDSNEDHLLDWKELDCAMPLVIEAGRRTLSSQLVDLDPFVQTGSEVALRFLSIEGFPSSIGKILAINGSIRKFLLEEPLRTRINSELRADYDRLATFLGSPGRGATPEARRMWILEARRRYGRCDANGDGSFRGSAESACVVDVALDELERLVLTAIRQPDSRIPLREEVAREWIARARASELVRTALWVGMQREEDLARVFDSRAMSSSSTAKLVRLLESILRRSRSPWEAPEC